MPALKNIAGQTFGRLTVLRRGPGNGARKRASWVCRCECGKERTVVGTELRTGHTRSCGCVRITHGKSKTKAYMAWICMNHRCNDPNDISWPNYGGRGISVCERWKSFENFLEDVGDPPSPDHSLDRINNDGNYEPSNVKWSTQLEQSRNQRTNRMIEFNGKTQCAAAWGEEYGIHPDRIYARLNYGWPVSIALTKPLRKWPSQRRTNLDNC